MDLGSLPIRVMMLVPTVLSLSVHEWAHAWAAWKLGDDTAAREGRLSLNPLVHIDPLGTVLLPLLGVPFGWAKPVPVNPVRFRRDVNMSTGMMITAAAGPISNVILAVLCALITGLLWRLAPDFMYREQAVGSLLVFGIQINVGLAIFNMLPFPPLDGSRVVSRFIPRAWEETWENISRFGPILLFAVVAGGGFLLARPISAVTAWMYDLIRTVSGH